MPQKTGPATTKKTTSTASEVSEAAEAAAVSLEAAETPKDAAESKKPEPQVTKAKSKDAEEAARAMYPEGTELWVGEVDGLVFAFPRIANITPTRQWLRLIYQLTDLAQTFEWMVLAKVPQEMQDRTDLLTDEQYRAVFGAWYVDGEIELPK